MKYTARMQAIKEFLADYWLWILIPALVLLGVLAAILTLSKDDQWSPTDYDTLGALQHSFKHFFIH